MELAISSRRVLVGGALRPAIVTVVGERIGAIVEPDADLGDMPVEDVGDCVLMAGLVDSHVHVNEPGRTEWEGFETATRAAAAGGITTIVDMPLNSRPVTTTARAFDDKLAATDGKLWVDVGFWGGAVPGHARELGDLVRGGVLGAKGFLCPSGIDDFPNVTEADLREAMPVLARGGAPLLVHAELERPVQLPPLGVRDYGLYLASRPPAFEEAAVALVIGLVRATGCPAHIVHLSSASALALLGEARSAGLPISAETCPHYLGLTAEEVPDGATEFKCAPPIRDAANREALWQGLRDGILDLVVSDHSPCTPELKRLDQGDFMAAWGGIASLGLGLPAVWTEARDRGFGVTDVARWMSERPARFAGLGRKGGIEPQRDADLVAWDPDASVVVGPEHLHQRHALTPWLGRTLHGVVHATWLRGTRIYGRERGFAATPAGRLLLGRS
jgi:allantoinase